MKKFKIHRGHDELGYKAVVVLLALTASLLFLDTTTGFAVYGGRDKLLAVALEHDAVRTFAAQHAYGISIAFLGEHELSYLQRKYPAIYQELSAPLYELRLESDADGMLILMSDASVYRTFTYRR